MVTWFSIICVQDLAQVWGEEEIKVLSPACNLTPSIWALQWLLRTSDALEYGIVHSNMHLNTFCAVWNEFLCRLVYEFSEKRSIDEEERNKKEYTFGFFLQSSDLYTWWIYYGTDYLTSESLNLDWDLLKSVACILPLCSARFEEFFHWRNSHLYQSVSPYRAILSNGCSLSFIFPAFLSISLFTHTPPPISCFRMFWAGDSVPAALQEGGRINPYVKIADLFMEVCLCCMPFWHLLLGIVSNKEQTSRNS